MTIKCELTMLTFTKTKNTRLPDSVHNAGVTLQSRDIPHTLPSPIFYERALYRAVRISSFTRGFKWSQISNQLTNSQVTAQWEDRCYLQFYLFIFSVTLKRILTCGISLYSEK
jgi:hypothetical protein